MKSGRWTGAVVLVSAWLLLNGGTAFAQTRTWVSGVGDDANPCSRTAPCKTFPGAVSKTAVSGEINVLDPGAFGPVTITKPITIDGSPFISGVLASGTNGIIINAGTNDVVRLRGLDLNGLGTGLDGIKIIQAGTVIIENCKIYNFTQNGVNAQKVSAVSIENSELSQFGQAGILFAPTSTGAHLSVHNVNVTKALNGGISSAPGAGIAAKVSINGSRLAANSFGFRATGDTNATISNTIASGNTLNGFVASASSTSPQIFIVDSTAVNNGASGVASAGTGAKVRLSTVVVTNNSVSGLAPSSGGTIETFSNVRNAGNLANGAPTGTIASQ